MVKIIQIKQANKIFKNRFTKMRRHDLIGLLGSEFLSAEEKKNVEKFIAAKDDERGGKLEFFAKRCRGSIKLIDFSEDD